MGTLQGIPANAIPTYQVAAAAAGVAPVTGGGAAAAIVAKNAPGTSFGATACLAASSGPGWLVGYNATTIPADGAINPALVLQAVPLPAGPSFAGFNDVLPVKYSTGVVYYVTSGASPYANKVSLTAAFISAKVS